MKRVVTAIAASLLLVIGYISCSEHDSIYFTDLPSEAQAFIQKYFPDNLVAKAERHHSEPRYEVTLDNGYEINFYSDGLWQEIDSYHAILLADLIQGVLPENIRNYLASEFPQAGVSAVERSSAGYNIELATTPTVELYFDPTGNVTVNWDD